VSAELRLEDVGKSFIPPTPVLRDITLTVPSGECLALVGPSGCGKTTLLRIIAGLEAESTGNIFIGGRNVNDVPAHERDVAMLFQRPALFGDQTVRQNLRWAWTLARPWAVFVGISTEEERELSRVAELLDLKDQLDTPLNQLSGGQQQRVGFGRCLLRRSKLVLLDEPLSHLDAPLRLSLRRKMRLLLREFLATSVYVTHDPEEAFAVGDQVAIMAHGTIVQMGEPVEVRRCPKHRYVVELIHHQTGGMNFFLGDVQRHDMDTYFHCPLGRWPMSVQVVSALRESLCSGENLHPGKGKVHIMMGVAAYDVRCSTASPAGEDDPQIVSHILDLESRDEDVGVTSGSAGTRLVGRASADERLERGQAVTMTFSMARAYWFDADTGRTLALPTG